MLSNLEITDYKKLIIKTALSLVEKKLTAGSWGNISVRINPNLIAVTPSGQPYDTLRETDILLVNASGEKLSEKGIPSSELPLHLALYENIADCQAIIHTHSTYASVCAALHQPIPSLLEDTAQIAGRAINVADYALAGTTELALNAVKAIGSSDAVLLANHGAVCCARSLEEALFIAEIVEKSAQVFCVASAIGTIVPLPDQDIKQLRSFYLNHYSKRQKGKE